MDEMMYHGTLKREEGISYIEGSDGARLFQSDTIWGGYLRHWLNTKVNARFLPQHDYTTGKNILILWPATERPTVPFVELYYNERLINYPLSLLGHMAINVAGDVFNFSKLVNENEILSEEEYLYRPALSEFAPHPTTGGYNIEDVNHPYYDKFGRLFMRSIHVLRIDGISTDTLSNYFRMKLKEILNNPDPRHPDTYGHFSLFRNNCVTIIRDGLRACGFNNIRGIFPRELFINAAYHIVKFDGRDGMRITMYRMPQLKVPEAPYSVISAIINPLNRVLVRKLPDY